MIFYQEFPYCCVPTRRALDAYYASAGQAGLDVGPNEIGELADRAVRALLFQRKGFEVNFFQFKDDTGLWAVCSRVTPEGRIDIEIDIGDPQFSSIIFIADERVRANLIRQEKEEQQRIKREQKLRRRAGL